MFSMFRLALVSTPVMAEMTPGSFLWMTQTRRPPARGWLTSGRLTLWEMLPFFR